MSDAGPGQPAELPQGARRGALLSLRPLVVADAPRMVALRARNREHFRHAEPARGDEWFTLAGQQDALAGLVAARAAGSREQLGIFVADEELVGWVSLSCIERGPWRNCNLAYSVDAAASGRGIATEAVGLTVAFAFDELGLHRVQAATLPDNHASVRVLEKNGFREEGFAPSYLYLDGAWRDHRIFARTAED